jgi:hypothetical protein
MLTQPIANLDYGHSKQGGNEYFQRRFFVEPGGDEPPKKRNNVGEDLCVACGLTEK